MPRWIVYLIIALICIIGALLVEEPDEARSLVEQQQKLQQLVTAAEIDLASLSQEHLHILEEIGPLLWMETHINELEELRKRTGIVLLASLNDSLICWSGSTSLSLNSLNGSSRSIGPNGSIFLHHSTASGPLRVHAVRPVWVATPINNRYLRSGFHPSLGMPTGLRIAEGGQRGPELITNSGEALLRLAWRDGALETGRWVIVRSIAILLSFVFFLMFLWSACSRLAERSLTVGILILMILIAGLRTITLFFSLPAPLDRLELFDPAVFASSFFFASLGDLLINSLLILFFSLFVLKMSVGQRLSTAPWSLPFIWSLIIGAAAWITDLIIRVVKDSRVPLDLFDLPSLDVLSILTLASMTMLFLAWLAIAVVLLRSVPIGAKKWIVLSAVPVIALSIGLFYGSGRTDILPWLWPLPALALIVPNIERRATMTHYIGGVLLLAAICSMILIRYGREREREERKVLAEKLINREDPVVELLFLELAPRLRGDRNVYRILTTGRPCSTSDLDEVVRQRFFTGYWERYDIRLFAFGTSGQLLCSTDPDPPRSFQTERSIFTDPRAAADMPDLLMEDLPGQGTFYHSRVAIMPVDTLPPAQVVIELYPRTVSGSFGFPDLLIAGDDPLGDRLQRYSFARYEHGRLAEFSGRISYPMQLDSTLSNGWNERDGHEHFVANATTETHLVLSLPLPKPLDIITTFSYLFTFFSLIALLTAIIIHAFQGRYQVGLRTKVRAALLLFAAISLLVLGIGARHLLDRQFSERADRTLLEKARSVHNELQQKLDGLKRVAEERSPYLDHLLGRASNVFFTDITIYDMAGKAIASSRPQMFTSGLLGPRMDPVAFTEVALKKKSSFIHEESVGSASFRSAYLPLRDRRGNVLAYLSLPSFADQRQQEEERSDVLIAVVNLFVLLFALSVLVALVISNWTLRPLQLLERGLRRVALRGNEPIAYFGEDEVGQLVQVYNRKVEELQRSAEQLARSERESAWRDMARQVAHEIKNPLTPMKLGIQQFQRSWDPSAPDAREKLGRFAGAMVEQIDSLNNVATAFSQFAQMPEARPERIEINSIVRAAVEVFTRDPSHEIELHAGAELWVIADREQLLRVFNNLLKNAIQSIPERRHGHITITISDVGSMAMVAIQDNGSGIEAADRDRIFTPSFTTKSSGMGLGLAMVKRIIEGSGGQVSFETEVGRGTTFFISLPLSA